MKLSSFGKGSIVLDNKLSWKPHISKLCKKLGRSIGLLYKIRNICNPDTMKSIYYSLFHSHMIYGISVWALAKTSLTKRIFLLQKKKTIQIISNDDFKAHTDPLFKKLNILKFADQYLLILSNLMWDFDHGKLPISLNQWFTRIDQSYNTRNAKKRKT